MGQGWSLEVVDYTGEYAAMLRDEKQGESIGVYSTLTSWSQVKRLCNRYFYNVGKVLALSAQGWPGACFSNKHAKSEDVSGRDH